MVNYDDFLDDMLARYPDVEGAMVADDNGVPIASLLIDDEQATVLAGLAAAMVSTCHWIVAELSEWMADDIMVRMNKGYMQIARMKKDKLLIAIMKPSFFVKKGSSRFFPPSAWK